MEEKDWKIRPTDDNRYIVLAIYDITNNKKRTQMVRFLEQYALRVQKSAFEGLLTPRQLDEMAAVGSKIIDEKTDSFRIYILYDHTRVLSWGRGEVKDSDNDVIIY